MSAKRWFKEVISGRDYMVNSVTGEKKIFSKCGTYLYKDENDKGLICEAVKYKPLPTLTTLFGVANRNEFLNMVGEIFVNDLGFTQKEFDDNKSADPPILNPLYSIWRDTRDASWLYNHKSYAFETLHCSIQVTAKPGPSGKICDNRFSSLYNTLLQLEMLDYDKKKEFKALDLCSGLGLTTLFLAKRFPNGTFYYNELNPQTKHIFSILLKKSGLKNIVILQTEELDEELDLVLGFEAVEHIPHPTLKGVGQPFEWVKPFLDNIKSNGHFFYQTMWNGEFTHGGNVLGHFLQYEFNGDIYGYYPDICGPIPVWSEIFHQVLDCYGFKRMQGKTGTGYKGLKWSFRGSPKVFTKTNQKSQFKNKSKAIKVLNARLNREC